MNQKCRKIMDELLAEGEIEEITWFKFQPKQELKLRLKDMLDDEVDEKYLLNQKLVSKYLETGTASNHKGSQAGKVADENDVFHTVNAGSHGYSMGYARLQQTHYLNIKGNESIKRIYSDNGLCPSLTTMQGGHREPKIAIANGLIEVDNEVRVKEATKLGYKVAEEGDSISISVPSSKTRRGRVGKQVAQTLDTACNQVIFRKEKTHSAQFKKMKFAAQLNLIEPVELPDENSVTAMQIGKSRSFGNNCRKDLAFTLRSSQCNGVIENKRQRYIFRKLTPRECFRLQGFDDSFIFPSKMSDTQLYKQAGNGMSRNILDMIFTQIFTCYAKHIENKEN